MDNCKEKCNISFFFEEKNDFLNDENELNNIIQQLNDEDDMSFNLTHFIDKDFYGNDELYYHHEYTVKELLKICEYYNIDKDIKSSKCKKQDIVSTLVYFEGLSENYEIVRKRNLMWAYMKELLNDNKMKKYVLWK